VRFVYLDETGISTKESVVVVAGPIMDADRDWRLVEDYLLDLIEEYIPEKNRTRAAPFHACEMFHGQGIFDPRRNNYPRAKAHEALKKLVEIPARFQLPSVCGHLIKSGIDGECFPFKQTLLLFLRRPEMKPKLRRVGGRCYHRRTRCSAC
jgi:hypothetical protein